jgi:acyl carrier protein
MNNQLENAVFSQELIREQVTKEQIREQLLDFICRQFLVDQEDIETDKSLVDTGIIDSMGLIEIASFIQQNFNFTVNEDDMNRKNFGSLLLIVNFIDKNLR